MMSIKSIIKRNMNKTASGKALFFNARILREKIAMLKSDKDCISQMYKKRFNNEIDLENPISFQEKRFNAKVCGILDF